MSATCANHLRTLAILATLSASLYAIVALLSWRFTYDSPTRERPIVAVLLLFAAAFGIYLFAIRVAIRAPQNRFLLMLILWPAILFRITLLPSVPIQEIDIYRYLWDGAVSAEGISPFRYSPDQVRNANTNAGNISTGDDQKLAKLVQLLDEQPAMAEILRRVHFGELPTIYPPTSQAVFAAARATTPTNASVLARVSIMKTWFTLFDLGTLCLVIGLLRLCQKPVGYCIVYAWCPLLLKEIANSGHLDAVAVFFTTLAVYLTARLLLNQANRPWFSAQTTTNTTVVAICLALAIGAKIYPIILAPLIYSVLAKRVGWQRMLVPAAVFVASTLFLIWPMLPDNMLPGKTALVSQRQQQMAQSSTPPAPSPSDSPSVIETPPNNPSLGLTTFLRRWEMNDFIFLIIIENLKDNDDLSKKHLAWFSVLPRPVRQQIIAFASMKLRLNAEEVPFILTRVFTAIAFLVLAAWFAWQAARKSEIEYFCEAGFLTLSWFWLLCPTQNPWYWTWALPLLAFARSRAWLAVSGLVLLYYLRFWLNYHWPNTQVLGSGYIGYEFFDFVVIWIEFAPWFTWLTLESLLSSRKPTLSQPSPTAQLTKHRATEK